MRCTIALLACFLTVLQVSAQKKLKYDIGKETGDTTWHTSEDRLYVKAGRTGAMGEHLKSTIYKTGTTFVVCFFIQTGRTNIFTLDRGASAEIKLENEEMITLSSRSDQNSRANNTAYGSYLFAFYQLNRSAINLLKASPVASIRIYSSLGRMDYEIKGKFTDVLADQLAKF